MAERTLKQRLGPRSVPRRGQERKVLRSSGRTRRKHAPVSAATASEHLELWATEMSTLLLEKEQYEEFPSILHPDIPPWLTCTPPFC